MSRIRSWLYWLVGLVEFKAPAATISFRPAKGIEFMAAPLVGTITPKASDPTIVKLTAVVTVGSNAPLTLDATKGAPTFPCNAGDSGSYTLTGYTAGGVASAPFTASFVAQDTVTVPATPSATIGFAPAPTA